MTTTMRRVARLVLFAMASATIGAVMGSTMRLDGEPCVRQLGACGQTVLMYDRCRDHAFVLRPIEPPAPKTET